MQAMARTWTLLTILAFLSTAYAAEHDVVVLTSGNRMTGSVTELSRGELSFDIDGAGTVEINWNNVVSLESSKVLDVELRSGQRFTGSITTPSPGKLEVRSSAGTQGVDLKDVIRIKPIEATFVERTSGSIDGGFSYLQAGNEFDWTLEADAENRTKNYLSTASFDTLLRRREGANDQMRNNFALASRRFLPNRWFVLGHFGVQEDQELDLDLRTLAYGAIGRNLVQSNRTILAVDGGIDWNHEGYGGFPTSNSPEALGTLEWDWFELGGRTELLTEASTFITLNRARTRFELKIDVRHDLVRKFYGEIGLFESFDSSPPNGLHNNDFGITLTIGRSF